PDGQVVALVRPEAVSLASNAPEPGTEAGSGPLTGTVIAITFLGATSRVTVDLGDTRVMAQLPTSEASALAAGSRVVLAIRPDPVLVSAGADPARCCATGGQLPTGSSRSARASRISSVTTSPRPGPKAPKGPRRPAAP